MHITQSKFLSTVCWPLMKFCAYLSLNHPVVMTQLRYFARYHKFANLKNPRDLDEKILWMKHHGDMKMWGHLSDKYGVRDYVKERGCEANLVKLYGVWSDANDIDFDALPETFVLKGANGSGSNIICHDKSKLDIPKIRKQMNKWIHTTIGLYSAELQYMHIPPRIVAEELLPTEEGSSSIADYKVWCFNGEPKYIWVCSDRDDKTFLFTYVMVYDTEWNAHPEYSIFNDHYRKGKVMPKPKNLDELLNVARKLSQGHPVVRCDLYYVKDKVYFGEMTFTSNGGMNDFYTQEFLNMTGDMIKLPNIK